MSFFFPPNLTTPKHAAPATNPRAKSSRFTKNKKASLRGDSITAMMTRLSRERRRNPRPAVGAIQAAPVEAGAAKATPKNPLLTAAIKIQRMARKIGIRKAKVANNFARLSKTLLTREEERGKITPLKDRKQELTTRLDGITIALAGIKEEKEAARKTMRKALSSNVMESKYCVQFMDDIEVLRRKSKQLKAEAVEIRQEVASLDAQIIAAEKSLLDKYAAGPNLAAGPSIQEAAPIGTSRQGGASKQETTREAALEGLAHERGNITPPPEREEEEGGAAAAGAAAAQEEVEEHKEVAPATPMMTISVSPDTSARLAAYLHKIDKTSLFALGMSKKTLEAEAKALSSALTFIEYMHAVRTNPGAHDSLNGILGNRKKASTVLVQLQKKLQKECGTYNKSFDNALIIPLEIRKESIESYAKEHQLDPIKLESLMSQVAHATAEDREEKTAVLTKYMIEG